MSLKRVEKKKLLGRHNKEAVHKAVLNNFAIFTGKHLCWRFFLIQNIAKFFEHLFQGRSSTKVVGGGQRLEKMSAAIVGRRRKFKF